MTQIAVFVDSGYLFAQGSVLMAGQRQPRRNLRLEVKRVLRALYKARQVVAHDARLLRVYWYDGVPRGSTTTPQQDEIAMAPYVKLRLGIIKADGGQKGVDSLIVLDLIELARNRAITDALIVSGDEDIRAGVLVAQNHGVRVHLLSVGPARGSQSPDLVKEADTLTEWQREDVADFLEVVVEDARGGGAGVRGAGRGDRGGDRRDDCGDAGRRVAGGGGEYRRQSDADSLGAGPDDAGADQGEYRPGIG